MASYSEETARSKAELIDQARSRVSSQIVAGSIVAAGASEYLFDHTTWRKSYSLKALVDGVAMGAGILWGSSKESAGWAGSLAVGFGSSAGINIAKASHAANGRVFSSMSPVKPTGNLGNRLPSGVSMLTIGDCATATQRR